MKVFRFICWVDGLKYDRRWFRSVEEFMVNSLTLRCQSSMAVKWTQIIIPPSLGVRSPNRSPCCCLCGGLLVHSTVSMLLCLVLVVIRLCVLVGAVSSLAGFLRRGQLFKPVSSLAFLVSAYDQLCSKERILLISFLQSHFSLLIPRVGKVWKRCLHSAALFLIQCNSFSFLVHL